MLSGHKHCFCFKLPSLQKHFLSGHNSKKQLHIFFSKAVAHFFLISFQKQPHIPWKTMKYFQFSGAATHLPKHKNVFQKQLHKFSFSEVAHSSWYLSEAAASFLKNMKYSQKQPHICLNIKNMFRRSCKFFSRLLHKIYTLSLWRFS